ncbi:unnamed protein product [Paramecium pentaurelia]|uniref:RNA-binding protein 25 n=1 Tax=Paramecium pentaurelia TaxID=43138 RepID=A0A8S1SPP0_9CILI|nr:unnamed protein product [Paramecium pentaurelia]
MLPFFPVPGLQDLDIPQGVQQDFYPKSQIQEPQEAKKLFIKNLPQELTNDNVEKLLKECGQLVSWKRSKGTPFGYAEFENMESVLKCLRLLNGMILNQKELLVKGGEKAQMMIDGWMYKKETEWEERRAKLEEKDKQKEEYRALFKFTSFQEYITRDDDKIKKKLEKIISELEGTVTKTKNDKKREEEKKEHPRERERDAKKHNTRAELERKYKEKMAEWKKKEDERERERKKEKEREIDREKNFQKYLEKELAYDSEQERKQIGKIKMNERKKFRQREFEEDEIFKKKELLKTQKPPEPEPPQMVVIIQEPPEPEPQQTQQQLLQQQQQMEQAEQMQQEKLQKEIDLKEELKQIFATIPTEKEELFNTQINWQLFAQSNLLEKKIRPWLRERCIEYLSQEERVFIDAIIKRLFNREKPQTIINKVVKKVLDDDSEQFVIRMWKMIIFELRKLERGLIS